MAYRRIANPRVVPLAWVRTAVEEQEEILGPDPWVYGLGDANRKNLETILRYVRMQGLISRDFTLEELFEPTDLGDAGGERASDDRADSTRRDPPPHGGARGSTASSRCMTARISSRSRIR